jgi:hypothetical protein
MLVSTNWWILSQKFGYITAKEVVILIDGTIVDATSKQPNYIDKKS